MKIFEKLWLSLNVVISFTCKAVVLILVILILSNCSNELTPLGENEAIRVYVEFADGSNRGMFDPETLSKGYADEDYDATTAMVINWHRMPESVSDFNARLRYRKVNPAETAWRTVTGESFEFWYREEQINRVLLKELDPGSVYEFMVREEGEVFRFRTMPSNLDERPVKIVMTADHQTPGWSQIAYDNVEMAAVQKPDMFVVAGDFVNDEGKVTEVSADRWATYLDILYGVDNNDNNSPANKEKEKGYFLYSKEIDGQVYDNIIIPHVSVLGNHETGDEHHIRWPADLYAANKGYPQFVAANWMQLLFHWPYSSEGFYSEFKPDHPNMNPEYVREGFGMGGFGKLSFSDYLLFIGLDNSQNWEGAPDTGLRDWEDNLITEKWPWFETHHSDVRQDLWLNDLLEPEGEPSAGETYTHIIPVWHRGLFGTVRQNMTFKNRSLLKYWLPVLYRNGVKLIKEGHDHNFTRTIPMSISSEQPEYTYTDKVFYEPQTWELPGSTDREYLENFYAVNTLKDIQTDEVVGWEYDGNYVTYGEEGMITIGHGGWAASRRKPGQRGGGNAGFWFVDGEKGGDTFGGRASFHITTLHLTNDALTVEAFHPRQLPNFVKGKEPDPIHRFRWNKTEDSWELFDIHADEWKEYSGDKHGHGVTDVQPSQVND